MKRLISSALLVAVLLCALIPTAALADSTQGYLGRVTASDTLNLRAEPNTDSKVLDKIEGGTSLVIVGSAGAFFKVSYDGKTGYLSDEYTIKLPHWVGVVTTDKLNLRKSPSTSSKIVGTIEKGDKVYVYAEDGEFYLIVTGSTRCYVSQKYIKKYTSSSSSSSNSDGQWEDEDDFDPKSEKYFTDEPLSFTEEELYMAAQLIYSEGNNQSSVSFQAMASVVYNRIASKRFPNTVEGVVFQANQFSYPDRNSEKFLELTPSKKAVAAVEKVFVEGKLILPPDVMYFKSASLNKHWGSSRVYYATIGGNMYYS